ncbi:MAG TPA: nicotinate phosphoribosyltransferase [Thiolinea sp.]|nr:nicotinate phosphoribosyltransferase [Thiolinea sp.]
MFSNLILNTDSYKASHYLQYPPGTEIVSSYIEARGGQFREVLFFGLQAFLKATLTRPITRTDIDAAAELFPAHGEPFNQSGWELILNEYGGCLPLEISALPEGMVVPVGTAMVQVQNTDPRLFWLTGYLETALLRAVWYPTTVATVSWQVKRLLHRYLQTTSEQPDESLAFGLHDFGSRGASSQESAALGGMAHLLSFRGTDTVAALLAARQYYGADMAGFSIPAAEHATITSWGRSGEVDAYANMLRQFARPGALLAVVSDSYDIHNAVSQIWGQQLRRQVQESGATLVVRPDSGAPAQIVPDVLERLYAAFGGRVNAKGYRVLSDCVRVIQGDGVDIHTLPGILESIRQAGFSTENVTFGMGAGLLQKVDRDTLSFAMKASAIRIDGQWRDVHKQPLTDPGKTSKRGRLAVVQGAAGIETLREEALQGRVNLLRPVYRNGELRVDEGFDTIRQRAAQGAGLSVRGQ